MAEHIITNGAGLFWSNTMGWVDRHDATVFSQEERDTLDLPIGGSWVAVGDGVYVRFEHGQENRISKELGPFPFVQLTYNLLLRVGPDGDDLAHLGVRDSDGLWWWNGQQWSDVVIYAK